VLLARGIPRCHTLGRARAYAHDCAGCPV
jgi:hypothetical protein